MSVLNQRPASLKKSCIYCGATEAITDDHVPPKTLFPKPRPDLITVPACKRCNSSFQKDDEYLAMSVSMEAYDEHPAALRVWESSLRPMILRGPRLRHSLSQDVLRGPVQTPAGLVVPNRVFVRFKKDRINRALTHIVRGLLWYHYQVKPPTSIVFETYKDPQLNEELREMLRSMTQLSWRGDTIFRYRHSRTDGDPDGSVWWLQFYGQTQFLVMLLGSIGLYSDTRKN